MEKTPKESSLLSIPTKGPGLPISQCTTRDDGAHLFGLRRRISSFSIRFPAPLSSSATTSWAKLRHSHSAPSFIGELAGRSLLRWWVWSLAWLLSMTSNFAKDLEMNEEELMLGLQSKGNLHRLFNKIKAEVLRLAQSETLPTTTARGFRYEQHGGKSFDEVKMVGGKTVRVETWSSIF